jgi:hypothetical protein
MNSRERVNSFMKNRVFDNYKLNKYQQSHLIVVFSISYSNTPVKRFSLVLTYK